MPGMLDRLADWLQNYKTTDGKAPNVLRSRNPTTPAAAASVIAECHEGWRGLQERGRVGTSFWLGNSA